MNSHGPLVLCSHLHFHAWIIIWLSTVSAIGTHFIQYLSFFSTSFPEIMFWPFTDVCKFQMIWDQKIWYLPGGFSLLEKKKFCASLLPSFWFTVFLLPAKVRNLVFIIWLLLVGIDSVTDKLKTTFSWMKNTLFCPFESPEGWKPHFRPGRTRPDACSPSRKWGLMAPCYSIQTRWLLKLKPLTNNIHKLRS